MPAGLILHQQLQTGRAGRGLIVVPDALVHQWFVEMARRFNLYPANPNGSAQGVTGFTTRDGRVTIMMPHPERVFRVLQNSWIPDTSRRRYAKPCTPPSSTNSWCTITPFSFEKLQTIEIPR